MTQIVDDSVTAMVRDSPYRLTMEDGTQFVIAEPRISTVWPVISTMIAIPWMALPCERLSELLSWGEISRGGLRLVVADLPNNLQAVIKNVILSQVDSTLEWASEDYYLVRELRFLAASCVVIEENGFA